MKIPRSKFKEGIDLCRKNALDYLNEARLILQKGSPHHAYVNVQLAIEEIGKALWLLDELNRSHADSVDVSDVVFGKNGGKSHWLKFKRASNMLKQDLLWVCRGVANRKIVDPRIVDVDKEASPKTRLLNAYVSFDEKGQKWYIGCSVDKSKLSALIQDVEQVVATL